MKKIKCDVLLFEKENIFDIEELDSTIRLEGLNEDELEIVLRIVDRSSCVNMVCFPYLESE